jgi:hypothetical protein
MTGSIRDLLLKHPYGGPDFGGCECGQIIGGGQDVWADHLAPIIADATTPRTITTAEELDALPDGSVVLDRQHDVAEKHSGRLLYRETRNMPLEYLAKHYCPFTVLHEGARNE